MVRRLLRTLIAVVAALAIALPGSLQAAPIHAGMMGMDGGQPCQNCPHDSAGKMPACQAATCISAPAVVPVSPQVPRGVFLQTTHAGHVLARRTGIDPAPDPFPPRPLVFL